MIYSSKIVQPVHSTIFGVQFEITNTEYKKQGQRKLKATAVRYTKSIQVKTTVNKLSNLAIYYIYK
jgi:hypothetical protein